MDIRISKIQESERNAIDKYYGIGALHRPAAKYRAEHWEEGIESFGYGFSEIEAVNNLLESMELQKMRE